MAEQDAYSRALQNSVPGQVLAPIGNAVAGGSLEPTLGALAVPANAAKFAGATMMDPLRAWMLKLMAGAGHADSDVNDTALKDKAGEDLKRSVDAAMGPIRRFGTQSATANNGGTLPTPVTAAASAAPPGVLPQTRVPVTRAPAVAAAGDAGGGLPATAGGDAGGGLVFSGSPDPISTASTAAAAPARKSLPELYAELIGKTNSKVDRSLNDDQRAEARNTYFANLMHGGPVAQPADSFRTAHNTAQAQIDKARAENIDLEKLRIGQERGDAANIVSATDKEADNARGDRKQGADEKHQERQDANSAEHMKILRQQIEQGNYKVLPAKNGRTYALYNIKTGEAKDTGMPIERGDTRPAEVKLLDYFQKNPEALKLYQSMHGEKGGISEKDIVAQGVEWAKAQMGAGGDVNPDEILRRSVGSVRDAAGRGQPKGTVKRGDAVYQGYLNRPDIKGDKSKLDAALGKAGYQVTD